MAEKVYVDFEGFALIAKMLANTDNIKGKQKPKSLNLQFSMNNFPIIIGDI